MSVEARFGYHGYLVEMRLIIYEMKCDEMRKIAGVKVRVRRRVCVCEREIEREREFRISFLNLVSSKFRRAV